VVGVRITLRIVIVEYDQAGAAQLLAIFGFPFRFCFRIFENIGGTVEVAGRRNIERPKTVRIFLAFNDRDLLALLYCFEDFGPAIERLAIDVFEAVNPAAVAVGPPTIEACARALRIAHLLKLSGPVQPQWLQPQHALPSSLMVTPSTLLPWCTLLRIAEHFGHVV
jgi:hypothetical protein